MAVKGGVEGVAGTEPVSAAAARLLVDGTLRSYAQIFFSRSRLVGALLLAATLVDPGLGAHGVFAVLIANLTAKALDFSADEIAEGLYGYNALLVGLGGAAIFEAGWSAGSLLLVAVVATVFVTAATRSFFGRSFGIPILTIPFLAIFYLLLAAGPRAGAVLVPSPMPLTLGAEGLPAFLEAAVRSLGSVFFTSGLLAGGLVLIALVVHSRAGALLASVGFVGAWLFGQVLHAGSDPLLTIILGYNLALTAMAIGGVWFVPSRSSFLLAAVAVAVAGAITVGLMPVMGALGLPLLILPLNLAVPLVLYAMRQRVHDEAPKAVDFLIGTPEQNLRYYQNRIARFGSRVNVRIRAPFLGRWIVTQGADGKYTHKGPWHDALDFEVADAAGATFHGKGTRLTDYNCFRLPVLACADGTVVRVVDGVADNPIGEVDTKQNWGNLVLVQHAPALYSLVCHLARGSVKVIEGQFVRQGEVIALCGSSGRSPVPHLHFHLQASPAIGAPTRTLELHDVVTFDATGADGPEGDGETAQLHGTLLPELGVTLRNLDVTTARIALPGLPQGEVLEFEGDGGREGVRFEIDLFGRRVLRSLRYDASLYFDVAGGLFTVYEVQGNRRSALHIIAAALGRVPLEGDERTRWRDRLDLRGFTRWPLSWLVDLVAPFASPLGVEMNYRVESSGARILIRGESLRRSRGKPHVRTQAVIDASAGGVCSISLAVGARKRMLRRVVAQESQERKGSHHGSHGSAASGVTKTGAVT